MEHIKNLIGYYLDCISFEDNQSLRLRKIDKGIRWSHARSMLNGLFHSDDMAFINQDELFTSFKVDPTSKRLLVLGYPFIKYKDQIIPINLVLVECEVTGSQILLHRISEPFKNNEYIQTVRQGGHKFNTVYYNYEVVLLSEPQSLGYTNLLQDELRYLLNIEHDHRGLIDLCLGSAINCQNHNPVNSNIELFEVRSLNEAQRNAAVSALSSRLTVVTGPPGTGKSELIYNIIINAFLQGKSIFFSTHNHKSLSVVEDRLTEIFGERIMMRTGRMSGTRDLVSESQEIATACLDESKVYGLRKSIDDIKDRLKTTRSHYNYLLKQLQNKYAQRHAIQVAYDTVTLAKNVFTVKQWDNIKNANLSSIKKPTKYLVRLLNNYASEKKCILNMLVDSLFIIWGHCYVKNKLSRLTHLFGQVPNVTVFSHLQEWIDYLNIVMLAINAQEAQRVIHINNNSVITEDNNERLNGILRLKQTIQELKTTYIQKSFKLNAYANNYPARSAISKFAECIRLGKKDIDPQEFLQVLSHIPIWGETTLSAGRLIPYQEGLFDLVIIDESSQMDIPSSLNILYRGKSAVVVGDDKQLKHITNISRNDDSIFARNNGVPKDAHNSYSFADSSLFNVCSRSPYANFFTLTEHYRSHPDIIGFCNKTWYQGHLTVCGDFSSSNTKPHAIEWIDIKPDSKDIVSESNENLFEANEVIRHLKNLEKSNYQGSIGVVTPFRDQVALIKKLAFKEFSCRWLNNVNLAINTAHAFQGDERSTIIFSLCVSHHTKTNTWMFLKQTDYLVNVAISRAREHLIIFGCKEVIRTSGISHLVSLLDYVDTLPATMHDCIPTSKQELLLRDALVNAGYEVVPQYQAGKYRVDLALFTPSCKYAIEVDGDNDHKTDFGMQAHKDILRDLQLSQKGWHVIRIPSRKVTNDIEGCLKYIQESNTKAMRFKDAQAA